VQVIVPGKLPLACVLICSAKNAYQKLVDSGSSNPSNPTSSPTGSSTPLPTGTTRSGDASAPLNNTGIAVVTVPNPGNLTDSGYSSFVKILFQDNDGYLSEKSSINGASIWNSNDNGNRIMQVLNGTPIAAASSPQGSDNNLPIRVFFVNTDGFLADVYQDIYGGTWTNGSLADRRFRPYAAKIQGITHNSLSVSWCGSLILYVEAEDLTIVAFQLSTSKTSSSWSLIPGNYGNTKDVSSSDNFASVCGFGGLGLPPVFVNAYGGTESTGVIYTWWNNSTYLPLAFIFRPRVKFSDSSADNTQQIPPSLSPPTPHPSTAPTPLSELCLAISLPPRLATISTSSSSTPYLNLSAP